jgi:hypothetical protein
MKNINPSGQPIVAPNQHNMPMPPAKPVKGRNLPAPRVPKRLPMNPKAC